MQSATLLCDGRRVGIPTGVVSANSQNSTASVLILIYLVGLTVLQVLVLFGFGFFITPEELSFLTMFLVSNCAKNSFTSIKKHEERR